MATSLWYNGSATIIDTIRTDHQRNIKGLRRGADDCTPSTIKPTAANWGRQARKVFKSRAMYMVENTTVQKVVFILTYPENHKNHKSHINAFIVWLKRHGMVSYVYTVEVGEKGGLIHYHWLAAIPYIKVQTVNDAWCKIRGHYSPNAVRLYRKLKVSVENQTEYIEYISKQAEYIQYISKSASYIGKVGSEVSVGRGWATSNNLVGKEKISCDNMNLDVLVLTRSKKCDVHEVAAGIFVSIHSLNRKDTREIFQFIKAINKRREAKQKEIDKRKLQKSKKRSAERAQMDFFQKK